MALVCIDVGHNHKSNVSPINPLYVEGVQMWKLWEALEKEFNRYGITSYNTRETIQQDTSLTDRGKMAKGADMFISLHSNASGIQEVTGTEIIVSNSATAEFVKMCHDLKFEIARKMKDPDNRYVYTRDYNDGSVDAHTPDVYETDYYGVLRGAQSVGCKNAAIIEHGFHTNVDDVEFLLNDNNLNLLALEMVWHIATFLNVKMPSKINPQTGART